MKTFLPQLSIYYDNSFVATNFLVNANGLCPSPYLVWIELVQNRLISRYLSYIWNLHQRRGSQAGRAKEREGGREERGPNFPTGIGAATTAAAEGTSSVGRFPFEACTATLRFRNEQKQSTFFKGSKQILTLKRRWFIHVSCNSVGLAFSEW